MKKKKGKNQPKTKKKTKHSLFPNPALNLKDIVDCIGCGFILGNLNGNIIYINPAFEKITGYSMDDLRNKNVEDLIVKWFKGPELDKVKKIIEHLRLKSHKKPVVPETIKWTKKNGKEIFVTFDASFLRDNKGKAINSIFLIKDITEFEQIRGTLQEKDRNYKALFESSLDGLIVLDAETMKIVLSNNAAMKMYGFKSQDEIIGISPLEFIADEDKERAHKIIVEDMFQKDLRQINEFRTVLKDGREIWISAIGTRAEYNGRLSGLISIRDITGRKEVEKELREKEKQISQLQKMEAIGRLAGGVAHDFNNMLTTIVGITQLLMIEFPPNDPRYSDFQEILDATKQASKLTRQLLTFSHRQMPQLQALDINAMLKDIESIIQRAVGEDTELTLNLDPNLGQVKADYGQMEQVIMNLVMNSHEAMLHGGKLKIITKEVTIGEKDCKTNLEKKPGKFILLSVIDTGIGINQASIQHIFEPFYTTRDRATGLGLSVVYGIIKQQQGWIDVRSKPGHGATFDIYLPVFSEKGKPEEEMEKDIPLNELKGNGERILLVEDRESVRKAVTKMLVRYGYKVVEAANAKEALDIFNREDMNFKIVFSDVVMAEKNGVELVDELISIKPDIKILLGSGYTNGKSRWDIISKKGYEFISKPYNMKELLLKLKKILK
ncbi:MAG: PAS domain S-box protein [Endomicrobiales bacterium]|nr:PAS domain S-box protein [Endomicrobiales bacterium]